MKIIIIILSLVFLNSCKSIKTRTTVGTKFGIGTAPNNHIDRQLTTQKQAQKAFKKYKKTILKCNPCRLIQKDINGNTISEGYAIKFSNDSHHHAWFGELITYDTIGNILNHNLDTLINIDEFILENPNKIRKYITTSGISLL